MKDLSILLGRLGLSAIFILSGIGKILAYSQTQGYMASHGLSGSLLPLVIALELGGGLAVAVGFLTRLSAIALAVFCVVSAFIFHRVAGDQMQTVMFMKNVAMAGGFLVLFAQGAGGWSIDNWSSRDSD
jgi:putative oxidoreductase